MQLLIEPYLKSLRKEGKLLGGNLVAICISALSVLVCVVLLNSLTCTVISIVVVLAIRSILLEKVVSLGIGVHLGKQIIIELILTILFIIFNWFVGGWIGFSLYALTILIYIAREYNKIIAIFKESRLDVLTK